MRRILATLAVVGALLFSAGSAWADEKEPSIYCQDDEYGYVDEVMAGQECLRGWSPISLEQYQSGLAAEELEDANKSESTDEWIDWTYGFGHCNSPPPPDPIGFFYSNAYVSTPIIYDMTEHQKVKLQLRKSPYIYKQFEEGWDDPTKNDSYRISYMDNKIDLCFHYKTDPSHILIENKQLGDGEDHTVITILSELNCGSPCSYGVTSTVSFSTENPGNIFFHKSEVFNSYAFKIDPEWLTGSIPLYPSPKFVDRLYGEGSITYANGETYSGIIKGGAAEGQAGDVISAACEKYESNWKGYVCPLGVYSGEWKDNHWHGQGTFTYGNGDKYVGEFRDSKFNGQGTLTFSDGRVQEGVWKKGKFLQKRKID